MIEELQKGLQKIRDAHNIRRGEQRRIASNLAGIRKDAAVHEAEQITAREAMYLLEHAGRGGRELITKKFNDIVTFALQSVFGEDYRFETSHEVKRNAVWLDFRVVSSDYDEPADPIYSRGGGVTDIISLALRVILFELYTPRIDGPLILDEPTKQLSKQFSSRAAEFLSAISERTGRQIILVTHDPILASAGKTFEL